MSLDYLGSFYGYEGGRGSSGIRNDYREKALAILFSPDSDVRAQLLAHSVDGPRWSKIAHAFRYSLENHVSTEQSGAAKTSSTLSHLVRRGGRGSNFDFEAHFSSTGDGACWFRVELKRGSSIYAQPQFGQYYARHGELVTGATPCYAEWFYDNTLEEVTELAGVRRPPLDEYLRDCFGTDHSRMDHTRILKPRYVPGSTIHSKLQEIAFDSIDRYLALLETVRGSVDEAAFQARLDQQQGKIFMSWDESQETFIAEEFTRDAMTVASGPTFKRRPSGLRSAVVMTNRAGHAIEALLRWKNDNCLLGPAWQVSLRA